MYSARHTESIRSRQQSDKVTLEFDHRGVDPPIRGVPDYLKRDEIDQLEYCFDFTSRLFDLAKPEDQQAYNEVYDGILNGAWVLRKRLDRWEPNWPAPKIWLEWAYVYREAPPFLERRLGHAN